MVLVEEESMSPKKLGHRIHGAFTATNEGSKYQNFSNSEDGTQTEQAIVEEDMIELTAVDGDKNTPKGDQDPNTQDLAADPVVSGNNSDNEANDTEDAAESTDLTGHRHLMKLVENDKVLSDEHVALIARQVVGLREHMVGLQDRLVPLFHLTTADFKLDQDALKDEENKSCCSKCCGSFMNVLSWPWRCIFKITIPECDRDSYQKWEETAVVYTDIPDGERRKLQLDEEDDNIDLNQTHWFRGKYSKQKVDTWYARSQLYWISFVMSIVWIWLTSWGMVDFAQHLGCLINIGPYIMGLVVLAAGTSIPDTLSSIMVARDGFGDMAVANAIGSNVFNIFLGIGLPMLLTELAWGEPFITSGTDPAAVLLAGVMLILITIFMIVILVAAKWVLSKPLAGFLMIFFVVYLVLSIVFEAEQQIAYDPIMEWLAYSC
jgi:Ca2+/Na+ antiporter